ncbi:hydroxypyruvate isomerase family protein [Thioalkalivibrio sp. HK1]|uniref:hydroxypyruvate isomerase family protein n=1 Tax=Thioalkalivibrio sp. HK1 TaxID=1469245 RepID=UPI0004725A05|nr:TIM barrel protein [Thioalkalivibrio sp. HK1]
MNEPRKFSANLGFLWRELALPDAIHAAKISAFDAVECHWPYHEDPERVAAALAATGLPMLSINTRKGDADSGEVGLSALPDRESEARDHIEEALAYADAIDAAAIHVMAGIVAGGDSAHRAARTAFVSNLDFATEKAAAQGRDILIEPLARQSFPGYFLDSSALAREVIEEVGRSNLKLLFDTWNLHLLEGDSTPITDLFERHLPIIGHIQFAAVPDRGPPDHGDIDYADFFETVDRLGYLAPLGAEYIPPEGDTEAGLGWMSALRGRD